MMSANIFLNCLYLSCFIIIRNCDAVEKRIELNDDEASEIIRDGIGPRKAGEIYILNEKVLLPSLDKHDNTKSANLNVPVPPNAEKIEENIPLEGGDVTAPKSNVANNPVGTSTSDDTNHSTGSKGRKGVGRPVSSVVPRKGVNQSEAAEPNNKLQSPIYETPAKILEPSNAAAPITKTVTTTNVSHEILPSKPIDIPKKVHVKKPEIVSDKDVPDDFDNYSIIKTSTTGEDYVIIGIVIVIGIWFSVFGALVFYRRAGEYWDRRHYRRMDFLVEGMYND